MCTFNGAEFLQAQLASFLAQTHEDWSLWISDDGSTDNTRQIVTEFCAENPDRSVQWVSGPQKGFAQNYISLVCRTKNPKGYIALSDQDDVWLPERLARVVASLKEFPPDKPAIYGCRTIRTDEDLNHLCHSRSLSRAPSFENALVQNILGGNTLAMNATASTLVRDAGVIDGLPFHDWWIYQLVSGAGGTVVFDDRPGLYYRQHSSNYMGAHRSLGGVISRLSMIVDQRYSKWMRSNAQALKSAEHLLTTKNQTLLAKYLGTGASYGIKRAWRLKRLGIHRQTRFGNWLLMVLAVFGRV